MAHKRNQVGSGVEKLEDRQMMAGDVTVTVANFVLTITGDADDNGVVVANFFGELRVVGIEQDGTQTTVNGQHRLVLPKIHRVFVDMGDGDDALVLTNFSIIDEMGIEMGDGDDILGLGQFDNTGELIPGTLIPESLVDDVVDPLRGPLKVGKNLAIDAGDGDNMVLASDVTVGRFLYIFTGSGEDVVKLEERNTLGRTGYIPGVRVTYDTTIYTGSADDELRLNRFSTRTLKASVEGGDDDVFVKNVSVSKISNINGGTGDNFYFDLGGNPSTKVLRRQNFQTVITT